MLFHHPHLNKINNQPSSKLNILQSKPFTQKNRSHTLIYGCQTHALHLSCSYHSSCLTLQQLKMAGFNSVPNWLLILKEEKFFTRCLSHGSVKKNEKNVFCLDCCTSICLHCLPFHRSHVFLQIRRYMYYDVLRLGDAETVLNCSLVQVRKSQNVIKHSIDIVILTLSEFMMTKQPYTTNKTKVVFLKQRPHTRSHRGSSNLCITCDRNLQDPYIFCSLSCKVQQHLLLITESTTMEGTCNKYEFSVLLDKERSRENAQQIEDSQITTDSELDSPTVSGSTSVAESVNDSLKKKRGSVDLVPEIWYTMVNRRKGVPHRSPLY
ncbi:uncharacterized protein LOC114173273 isoform X2 [Vigna unguiculata]|uniref:uncharacterized protein LOC114173273 isoform X2 n=1 Tax=Vigna unguiculata TaxID=3917 RepID=UPI001016FFC9|nr:uncharacterized protein LOC114173273 isoform X2 [Vigna unguiculata]